LENGRAKRVETVRVFRPARGAAAPVEVRTVAVVAAGDRFRAWWGTKGERVDFYDLKGVVETLDKIVGVSLALRVAADIPYLHPGQQAEVVLAGGAVGSLGTLHPEVIRNFDLKAVAVAMEIDLDRLDRDRKPQARDTPPPRDTDVFLGLAL